MLTDSAKNRQSGLTSTALRGIAGVTSATSAIAAYPIASELFGLAAGSVVVASSAATIYAGWHFVGTEKDTTDQGIIKRVGAGVIASAFAVAMVVGIHASADLSQATTATSAASDADKLYAQQEQARINALTSLSAELRATQKSKYPAEYAALQSQVEKLSTPTPRQATATQITQGIGTTSTLYRWGVASVFELVTPALLLLAGLFSRRQKVDAVDTLSTQSKQLVNSIKLTAPTIPPTPPLPPIVDTFTGTTDDILAQLSARTIPANDDDYITVNAIRAVTNCTERQAREAIRLAVQNHYLIKAGEGNASRYYYPKQSLRIINGAKV